MEDEKLVLLYSDCEKLLKELTKCDEDDLMRPGY